MTRPDIERLIRFTRLSDRELTPYFAGREKELQLIQGLIEEIAKQADEGNPMPAAGKTLLITGAPGAGKTALATKVGRQLEGNGGGVFLPIDLEDLADRTLLQSRIEARLSPDRLTSILRKAAEMFRRAGTALPTALTTAMGASGEDLSASIVSQLLDAVMIPQARDRSAPCLELPYPVVLFIDEIQAIDPQIHLRESATLKSLHLGTCGQPILPVLAGLADARPRLCEAGLSRLGADSILTLGSLSADDAALSAQSFFVACHLRGRCEHWTRQVASWSGGWPMHVHNSLRAIAEEMVRYANQQIGNGDPAALTKANPTIGNLDHLDEMKVRHKAAVRRAAYYRSRLSGSLSCSPELVARIMERVRHPLRNDEIRAIIREEYPHIAEKNPDIVGLLPITDVFDGMLRSGLVQPSADDTEDRYICPIPSLRSYCVISAATRLHMQAYLGDRDGAQSLARDDARIIARDLRGRTPADVAGEEEWTEIHAVLHGVETRYRARRDAAHEQDAAMTKERKPVGSVMPDMGRAGRPSPEPRS